jgi:glycosyltransferase involved in cell wall biosynthesis
VSGAAGRILRQQLALGRALPALAARSLRRARRPGPPRLRFVFEDLGGATRYRVHHQIEQAALAGFEPVAAPLSDTRGLYDLADADLLYLHRVPLTSRSLPLLFAARGLRVPVVFDSDDLVWDEAERQFNHLDAHYDAAAVADILKTARRLALTMRRADALVLATPHLARLAAGRFPQPTYVNANAVSAAMVAAAEQAYVRRGARPADDAVTIGYFCGTARAHDEDFALVAPVLRVLLDQQPRLRLRCYGGLRVPDALSALGPERVELRPAVPWDELLAHVAAVDIAIAPLIDNPQRRAKSAVKVLEAALVGVPTVAQRLDPYEAAVEHGVTGFLAAGPAEWHAALQALVSSPEARRSIGEAARAAVLAEHTTARRSAGFAAIVNSVLE